MDRRSWLRLSAGALLALGEWPGRLRAADNGRGEAFRFVEINDLHFQSPRCPDWFARVSDSIRGISPKPDLCLVVGDLSDHGLPRELGAIREVLRGLDLPFYPVIGNHDYLSDTDRSGWDALFPEPLNLRFEHRGWQFVGLDSTFGTRAQKTDVQPTTLRWLDETLPKLDRAAPTVLFTHFPLGHDVPMRPLNADVLLGRFQDVNLVAVFNGHHHGFTERNAGHATLTTNRCCAISRDNHDGTLEKGYFLCSAEQGTIRREFIEVKPA